MSRRIRYMASRLWSMAGSSSDSSGATCLSGDRTSLASGDSARVSSIPRRADSVDMSDGLLGGWRSGGLRKGYMYLVLTGSSSNSFSSRLTCSLRSLSRGLGGLLRGNLRSLLGSSPPGRDLLSLRGSSLGGSVHPRSDLRLAVAGEHLHTSNLSLVGQTSRLLRAL